MSDFADTLTLKLREIEPEDLDELWRLDQACFDAGVAYTKPQLRFFLTRPQAVAVAAETEKGIAGFAVGDRSGRRGHIVTIDVAARDRRRGVGRALLSEMIRRLEEAGVRHVRLEVEARNRSAIRFYEGFGFARIRELPGYYGLGRDGIEMVLDVKRGSRREPSSPR